MRRDDVGRRPIDGKQAPTGTSSRHVREGMRGRARARLPRSAWEGKAEATGVGFSICPEGECVDFALLSVMSAETFDK